MRTAQIAVLAIALSAGGLAMWLMSQNKEEPQIQVVHERSEPTIQIVKQTLETVDVLVAATDIGMGRALNPQDMKWQQWPLAAASQHFIRRNDRPNALEELANSTTRTPFVGGEPIRENKLIKSNGQGFLSAILPSGMRAVSTEISPETASGGFILPNDRVDVILTRRDQQAQRITGIDVWVSETVLQNVKVLAIDQTIEEKNGERVVVGRTATLELAGDQAEQLLVSRSKGTLSLALRSITDAEKTSEVRERHTQGINLIRYGVNQTINVK